jgi:hypothetical protein
MKQLLVLALTTVMVLAISTVSLAGTVSLDYFMGNWDVDVADGDLTGIGLALDVPFDPWKIGVDYMTLTADTPTGDADSTLWEFKFGYLISSSDALNFYLDLGYFTAAGDDSTDDITAYMLSADLNFLISDASSFDVSLGLSIAGEVDNGSDVSIISAKLKYSYYFSDSFGMGIGYRYYNFTIDDVGDTELNYSGLTLGVAFKF